MHSFWLPGLALCLAASTTSSWIFPSMHRSTVPFPLHTNDRVIHEHFMRLAIEEASRAAARKEVPIGAVVVRNVTDADSTTGRQVFRVLSLGRNEVEGDCDASAHAEIVALRRAAKSLRNWRLLNCTLYSTLEPCPMCLSACQAFRLSRLVYGAPDLRLGAVETHMRLLDIPHPFHNVSVVDAGVLESECAEALRDFFRARRKKSTRTASTSSGPSLSMRKRLWSRLMPRTNPR
jgi:tRNA(adenine34) deaminase